MNKNTLVKLLCLAIACMLLIPMIIACGGDETPDSTPAETVVIMYEANGGVLADDKLEQDVVKGEKATHPTPTREGFTFTGWYYDEDCTDKSARTDKFNADTVLYAGWKEASATPESTPDSTPESTPDSTPSTDDEEIVISYNTGDGYFENDDDYEAVVVKGERYRNHPTPINEGFVFGGWYYDEELTDKVSSSDKFNSDVELFAKWTAEATSTPDSTPSSTPDSTPSSTPDSTPSSTPDSTQTDEKITIFYEPGNGGYFESDDDYEKQVSKGGRFREHPTPLNELDGMVFKGWYTDSALTTLVSSATKYDADTTLYAKWAQLSKCIDGSYDHNFGIWEDDTPATCTKPAVIAQYCSYCQAKQTQEQGEPAGHLWDTWKEAFMRMERSCGRLGCTDKEIKNYTNVTIGCLGNNPGDQVSLEGPGSIYNVPLSQLYNAQWDEEQTSCIAGRGDGTFSVIANLVEAQALDRIYFKGRGGGTVNVYVQYEGESDYTMVGACAFITATENAKPAEERQIAYVSPDATKKIVSVKFTQENPPQGTSFWEEFAFVKVATEE